MALSEREILNRLRDAVVALKEIRAERDTLLAAKNEPIAIIGMACRFPGDSITPEAFYKALVEGQDTVTAVPAERWSIDSTIDSDPQLQGARWGAFVKNVNMFEPAFFGISPREAERMDPQQRFLLETTWEALERGGLVPAALSGSKTGVFVGIMNTDYYFMNMFMPREAQDAYSATGNGHCFPAGRIAYTFGFQGPTMTIDTACSSSLVATHVACQSLRTGDSDIAIVCGVNLMLDSALSELTAKTGALAPDGRCKSFDSRANGYVRGEGCGVIVLKRLSDAQRDGDTISAVIRGSAVNQDGRSTGLTTPNVLSQQAMLEQALANARVTAEDLGYIEAHGTGTPLGDPIEMEALRTVLGKPRPNGEPLWIGTVKTNIGHLEAAAGVAGLIKTTLALNNERIPKNLHLRTMNPRISLEGSGLKIATDVIPWPKNDKPRRAGVSSFGMSGTNAHVIVEEAPVVEDKPKSDQRSTYLLPLSAKNANTLTALARSYAEWLPNSAGISEEDIVHTAGARRTHHEHRIAAIARNHEEFTRLLTSFASGEPSAGMHQGRAALASNARILFVFSGQGSQWAGMGQSLFAEEPIFRAKIEEIDALVQKYASFSLIKELAAPEAQSRLGETEVVQPALFAIQIGLVELFKSWGFEANAVVGHSVGEIAAAHACGALSLEDAVHLAVLRGRIMQKATGRGKMVWVALPREEALRLIAGREDLLAIAAINDPSSVVLSGETRELDAVITELGSRGVTTRPLRVNYAFHSPQMEPYARELVAELPRMEPRDGSMAMYSTVTGERIDGKALVAEYWGRNIRGTVDLAKALKTAFAEDFPIVVEVGPHPVLVANIEQCASAQNVKARIVATLRRQAEERRSLLEMLGALYVDGLSIDWKKLAPNGKLVTTLPTYPWQRQRYWIEAITRRAEIAPPVTSLDDWLFTLEWHLENQNSPPSVAPSSDGDWLVFMDSGRIGKNVVLQLKSKGSTCIRVDPGNAYEQVSPQHYRINAADPAEYSKLLGNVFANGRVCRGVIYLGNLDGPSWDETTVDGLQSTRQQGLLHALYLTQALVRQAIPQKPRLWLVTHGAIAIKSGEPVKSVSQASLWGLGRTIMLEHPELRCTCIDLDVAIKFDTVKNLVRQFEMGDREEQVALRPNGRFVARFARAQVDQTPAIDFKLKGDGSYLITGGLGGLGLSLAQWMVEKGAKHIALMARRKPSSETQEIVKKMKAAGAHILVLQGDVAHPDDVLQAMCAINAEMPELKGVVHAAGVVADRTLLEQSSEHWETVFAPKVDGAWNLHTLTLNENLDFFVLYSSAASLFGSPGQANYAAANAFLDSLAQARLSRGLPAMSIQWGPFSEVGMAAANVKRGSRIASRGMDSLSPNDGLRALANLLEHPRSDVGVMRLDLRKWLDSFPDLRMRSSWSNLAALVEFTPPAMFSLEKQAATAAAPATGEKRFVDEIARAPLADRPRLVELQVRRQVGLVLRMDPAKIGRDEKIQNFGLDSLMAIELRNRLQTSFETQVSVADIWTRGSVGELASWLGENFGTAPPPSLPAEPAKSTSVQTPVKSTPQVAPVKSTPLGAQAGSPGSWIVVPRPLPNAKMRLICFPYAGGGAPVYSSWPDSLPPDIEVIAIQPPGRLARIKEPLAQSVDEMVRAILAALLPYLDRPFATFGHCLGAIVMFEVVQRLASEHWTYPLQLFASGAPPPKQYLLPNLLNRSDEEFLGLLRAIGLTDQEVLNDPDLVRALLPMVRSDFQVAANYRYKAPTPLDIPIVTFAGDADAFAPPLVVEGWRHETTAYFSKHNYSGGHYFLVPERDSILRIVALEMAYRSAALQHRQTRIDALRRLTKTTTKTQPVLRLICFPGLGGIAADFQALASTVPADVDVCALEMPGHGTLIDQAPLGRVEDLVAQILNIIGDLLDRPVVFVGHDLGALVMYETALRLGRTRKFTPKSLVVLGAMGPNLHYFAPIHEVPAENLPHVLQLFGIQFDEKRATLQAVRADCAAMANYSPGAAGALDAPITALTGMKDGFVASASVDAWQRHTTSTWQLHRVDCNHGDLLVGRSALELVKKQIEGLLEAARR